MLNKSSLSDILSRWANGEILAIGDLSTSLGLAPFSGNLLGMSPPLVAMSCKITILKDSVSTTFLNFNLILSILCHFDRFVTLCDL